MFIQTLRWLSRNLWFNASPFVHGDLSDDNIVVSPDQLWIIDFEPGLFEPLESELEIFMDYMQFHISVLKINQTCNEKLGETNHVLPFAHPSLPEIFEKQKDKIPLNEKETRIIHTVLDTLRQLLTSGGKKSKRKLKRKSKRKTM